HHRGKESSGRGATIQALKIHQSGKGSNVLGQWTLWKPTSWHPDVADEPMEARVEQMQRYRHWPQRDQQLQETRQ
ncbi:MAG: hypothetical protein WCD18_20890, partial [Thermosynechococcaceae cyanobacterium]